MLLKQYILLKHNSILTQSTADAPSQQTLTCLRAIEGAQEKVIQIANNLRQFLLGQICSLQFCVSVKLPLQVNPVRHSLWRIMVPPPHGLVQVKLQGAHPRKPISPENKHQNLV